MEVFLRVSCLSSSTNAYIQFKIPFYLPDLCVVAACKVFPHKREHDCKSLLTPAEMLESSVRFRDSAEVALRLKCTKERGAALLLKDDARKEEIRPNMASLTTSETIMRAGATSPTP